MEIAVAVLCWALAVSILIVAIMLCGYLDAVTDLTKARLDNEKRLH